MQENTQVNPFVNLMKKIWPYIYRVINGIFYFLIMLIKNFVKDAIKSIKGV